MAAERLAIDPDFTIVGWRADDVFYVLGSQDMTETDLKVAWSLSDGGAP